MYICTLINDAIDMKKLYVFDFDGTLTTRDTLLEFIRYAWGTTALYRVLLMYSPLILLMKLHLYSNHKVKEKVFSSMFKGMEADWFGCLCRDFATTHRDMLRPGAAAYIEKLLGRPDTSVVVVSASIESWIAPFFYGIPGNPIKAPVITVIGTRHEVRGNTLTGKFLTPNCYGQEKVRRLLELFPDRNSYHLTAFGDSRGDRELLAFADEAHYKPFRADEKVL